MRRLNLASHVVARVKVAGRHVLPGVVRPRGSCRSCDSHVINGAAKTGHQRQGTSGGTRRRAAEPAQGLVGGRSGDRDFTGSGRPAPTTRTPDRVPQDSRHPQDTGAGGRYRAQATITHQWPATTEGCADTLGKRLLIGLDAWCLSRFPSCSVYADLAYLGCSKKKQYSKKSLLINGPRTRYGS